MPVESGAGRPGSEGVRPGSAMSQTQHTRKRPKPKRKVRKSRKRRWLWRDVIGLASLVWSVFRFVWEQVHRGQ